MLKPSLGRTFPAAAAVLALVGAAQVGVWFWKAGGARSAEPPAPVAVTAAAAPAEPPRPPAALRLEQELVAAEAEKQLLAMIPKPTPVPAARREAAPVSRIGALVDLARALRDRGDMSTALTRLREAQVIAPNDSRIISEMAITYEKMGLTEKAIDHWRRIYEMGEAAGIYYAAAEAKLKALQLPSFPAETPEPFLPGGLPVATQGDALSLGKVGTTDDTGNSEPLRRLKLRIPIHARPESQVDVRDVVIQVFFYDQLADGSLAETNADVSSTWARRRLPNGEEAGIDWSTPEPEVLQVEYAQAEPGAGLHERRNYFGYVVRVYYKGELNAAQAEPARLLQQFPPPPTLQTTDLPQ